MELMGNPISGSTPGASSPHAMGGADHSADTLADVNTKISDATLNQWESITEQRDSRLGGIVPTNSSTALPGAWGSLSDLTITDDSSIAFTGTSGRFFQQTTTNSSGNAAYIQSDGAFFRLQHLGSYWYRFSSVDLSEARFFAGLASSTGPLDADDGSGNYVGVQFSTGRGDTTFQWVADGGTQTVTNTGVTAANSTVYAVRFVCTATTVTATLFDDAMTTILDGPEVLETNLPSATTNLYFLAGITTLAANTASLNHYQALAAGL